MRKKTETPNIPIKPPFIFYSGLAIGGFLHFLLPVKLLFFINTEVRISIAILLFVLSLLIMTMAVISFKKAGTNGRTDRPATAMVTNGIFKITRNPMYLSLCLLGLAITFYFNSAWLLAGTLIFCICIHHIVIPAEESYMEKTFGSKYTIYMGETRRWL